MLTIHRLNAVKKAATGTPGSSAWQRGFDVEIITEPGMAAYRVAIIWTPDGWNSITHTEARLVNGQLDRDLWAADVSYFTTPPTTYYYALVAAGADGLMWDNNNGWNYMI